MGTWSIPWKTLESAQRFREHMSKPWTAKVTRKDRPDFGEPQTGDCFSTGPDGDTQLRRNGKLMEPIGVVERWDWDADELYELFGTDSLFDTLGFEAERLKADFDVREAVSEALRNLFEDCMTIGEDIVESNLEAVNVCRKAGGLDEVSL